MHCQIFNWLASQPCSSHANSTSYIHPLFRILSKLRITHSLRSNCSTWKYPWWSHLTSTSTVPYHRLCLRATTLRLASATTSRWSTRPATTSTWAFCPQNSSVTPCRWSWFARWPSRSKSASWSRQTARQRSKSPSARKACNSWARWPSWKRSLHANLWSAQSFWKRPPRSPWKACRESMLA